MTLPIALAVLIALAVTIRQRLEARREELDFWLWSHEPLLPTDREDEAA